MLKLDGWVCILEERNKLGLRSPALLRFFFLPFLHSVTNCTCYFFQMMSTLCPDIGVTLNASDYQANGLLTLTLVRWSNVH